MIFTNYLFKNLKYYFFLQLIYFQFYFTETLSQNHNFYFSDLNDNAKVNSLGGNNISSEHGYFILNPALIKHNLLTLNYFNYIVDISSSSILFSDSTKFLGNYGLAIKYLSHGKFKNYDINGNYNGDFYPKEYILNFSKSYSFSKFRIGTNLKYHYSKFYEDSNSAFLVDIGGLFKPHRDRDLTIGIVISNVGFTVNKNIEKIKSDLKIGSSFKPKYMPFRFSFSYLKKEIDYQNISLGIEVLLSRYFNIMLGYNRKIEKGFEINSSDKFNGFSYGLELILKRFNLNYSRLILNSITNTNNISINYKLKRK